jgi:signal peptidase
MRLIWSWLQIVGAAVALVAVLWLGVAYLFHLKLLNVQTGSMVPTFRPGDALIMQRLQPSKLKPGMIVSYKSSRNPNELITHRAVTIGSQGFQTKGDAMHSPDPAVRNNLLVGRVVTVLPRMGRVLSWIQSLPGLIVCVYLPALAITIQELVRLERRYAKSHRYRLYEMI